MPETLQYAGDEDCLAFQLMEVASVERLGTEIRRIMSSSLERRGALLLRGLKVGSTQSSQ